MLKALLKKVLPKGAFGAYHRTMAQVAALRYGNPSRSMIVIGVTGTNGKSTTSNMVAAVLEGAGYKVGLATTCNFRIAGKEWINDTKMTMLGRFRLQKLLAQMRDAGCRYAVVETSSEGIAQHRHTGIAYDVAVFTNLTPEHIESHGSFENYKAAKGKLFAKLSTDPRKSFDGKDVPKVIVANLDSEHSSFFLGFTANKKYGFAVEKDMKHEANAQGGTPRLVTWPLAMMKALAVQNAPDGVRFTVREVPFRMKMRGSVNVENAMAAIAVGLSQGIDLPTMAAALAAFNGVPGRQEFIFAGGSEEESKRLGQNFTALVDYAHEPAAFKRLYEIVGQLPHKRIVQIIGSAGGGRDKSRRTVLGDLAGQLADVVIVTNEDPYDEDPAAIIEAVASGARGAGKRDGIDLFVVPERRDALALAATMAAEGDVIVATGKGAEQWICVADGKKVRWDERTELRQAIEARLKPVG